MELIIFFCESLLYFEARCTPYRTTSHWYQEGPSYRDSQHGTILFGTSDRFLRSDRRTQSKSLRSAFCSNSTALGLLCLRRRFWLTTPTGLVYRPRNFCLFFQLIRKDYAGLGWVLQIHRQLSSRT